MNFGIKMSLKTKHKRLVDNCVYDAADLNIINIYEYTHPSRNY